MTNFVQNSSKMSHITFKILPGGPTSLVAGDPQTNPVVIVGQQAHVQAVPYQVVQSKLQPRVSEEIYKIALENLNPSPTDSIPLYMNSATLIALSKNCSRHNTPSRAHSLSKLIKSSHIGGSGPSNSDSILVVCEKSAVFALACAAAKAFPLYSRKAQSKAASSNVGDANCNKEGKVVNLEFLTVSKVEGQAGKFQLDQEGLTSDEVGCLQDAVRSVRHAARLVDTPCSELHTDAFVEVHSFIGFIILYFL